MVNRTIHLGKTSLAAPDSAAYTNFIARTTGLNSPHLAAYKALLDGLTTDSLCNSDGTSNYFDALYIFATQDSTTALLNLIANQYNATLNATPTFTADSDYFNDAGSEGLRTGFNPSTASSPKFTQNSAHLSVWNLTNATADNACMGNGTAGNTGESHLFIKFSDNTFYPRITPNTAGTGVAISDPRGLLLGTRTSSSNIFAYQNGSQLGSAITNTSGGPFNAEMLVLQGDTISSPGDAVHHIAAASIGAALDATKALAFYTRMRTYMTAVGVP